ncbi:MAG: hypothetical protein Fur006_41710 [Coleofasciculaceae cyanobacterium]
MALGLSAIIAAIMTSQSNIAQSFLSSNKPKATTTKSPQTPQNPPDSSTFTLPSEVKELSMENTLIKDYSQVSLPINKLAYCARNPRDNIIINNGLLIDKNIGELTIEPPKDNNHGKRYKLLYFLPDAKGCYAFTGFKLEFPNLQDIKNYKNLELNIEFGDKEAHCKLCIKSTPKEDCSNKNPDVFVVINGEGYITRANGEQLMEVDLNSLPIKIPLKYFNTSEVKLVTFEASTDMGGGKNSFTVSDVKFSA